MAAGKTSAEKIPESRGCPVARTESQEMAARECRDRTYRHIINTYGPQAQMDQAIEEMSELTKALIKYKRATSWEARTPVEIEKARKAIIDELADVAIMERQMELLFQCETEVDERIDFKIRRQEQRMMAMLPAKESHEEDCAKPEASA